MNLDQLLTTGKLAIRIIFFITLGFYLTTLGNPRSLRTSAETITALTSWPPTAVFRWRKHSPFGKERDGYEVVAYNQKTDEDNEIEGALYLAKWCPTYLMWPKKRPQSKNAMLRTARITFLIRVFFFVAFFLGSFSVLAWLTFTQNWRWSVALGVLAIHQLAFYRANTYLVWLRWWLLVVIGLGTWVYLRGGWYETAAICGVGAVLTLAILGQWHMVTSSRFEHLRELRYGPFDPSRERGRPW